LDAEQLGLRLTGARGFRLLRDAGLGLIAGDLMMGAVVSSSTCSSARLAAQFFDRSPGSLAKFSQAVLRQRNCHIDGADIGATLRRLTDRKVAASSIKFAANSALTIGLSLLAGSDAASPFRSSAAETNRSEAGRARERWSEGGAGTPVIRVMEISPFPPNVLLSLPTPTPER